jgi:hypothetical protein
VSGRHEPRQRPAPFEFAASMAARAIASALDMAGRFAASVRLNPLPREFELHWA